MERDESDEQKLGSIKISQYLYGIVSSEASDHEYVPLLQHHHQSLNQEALDNLRRQAFVQSHDSLVPDNVSKDLRESAERLALSTWWRL